MLAKRYGLSRTTVNKWRSRSTTADARMGPREPRSTVLTPAEAAIIVAFRQRTLLPLDDVMGCLREQIPKLTRSGLHRCLAAKVATIADQAEYAPGAVASLLPYSTFEIKSWDHVMRA